MDFFLNWFNFRWSCIHTPFVWSICIISLLFFLLDYLGTLIIIELILLLFCKVYLFNLLVIFIIQNNYLIVLSSRLFRFLNYFSFPPHFFHGIDIINSIAIRCYIVHDAGLSWLSFGPDPLLKHANNLLQVLQRLPCVIFMWKIFPFNQVMRLI